MIGLALITGVAALVNGALGYGFSSITVPVALVFLTNRVLNPAMVLVEVGVNLWSVILNRRAIPLVRRKVLLVFLGLFPGIAIGSLLLRGIDPSWVKLVTYVVLLPLLVLQLLGIRRPMNTAGPLGGVFGVGVGTLYSVTTISGPPLALVLNNEGLVKEEFRAALAVLRLAESTLALIVYLLIGVFTAESLKLLPWIVPSAVIGMPLGAMIASRLNADVFRKICMGFDIAIVAYGLYRAVMGMHA